MQRKVGVMAAKKQRLWTDDADIADGLIRYACIRDLIDEGFHDASFEGLKAPRTIKYMKIEDQYRAEAYGIHPIVDATLKSGSLTDFDVQVISQNHETIPREDRAWAVILNRPWTAEAAYLGYKLRSTDFLSWVTQVGLPSQASTIVDLWCHAYDCPLDRTCITTYELNKLPRHDMHARNRIIAVPFGGAKWSKWQEACALVLAIFDDAGLSRPFPPSKVQLAKGRYSDFETAAAGLHGTGDYSGKNAVEFSLRLPLANRDLLLQLWLEDESAARGSNTAEVLSFGKKDSMSRTECTSRLQAVRDKIKERLPRVVVRAGGQAQPMTDSKRHLLSLRFNQLNICRASANNKSCARKVLTHPRRKRKTHPWNFSANTRL